MHRLPVMRFGRVHTHTLVDADTFLRFQGERLTLSVRGYVKVWVDGRRVSLHRLVMAPGAGQVVHHLAPGEAGRLDNRRCSLQVMTAAAHHALHARLGGPRAGQAFKGVRPARHGEGYAAYIRLPKPEGAGDIQIGLGSFPTAAAAARAYDARAFQQWGGDCYLNDPASLTRRVA